MDGGNKFLIDAIAAAVTAARPPPRAPIVRVPKSLEWPRVTQQYTGSGRGQESVRDFYQKYRHQTTHVPDVFCQAHFLQEGMNQRTRESAQLHFKNLGHDSLHEVQMEDLLEYLSQVWDIPNLDHTSLVGYMKLAQGGMGIKEYIRHRTERRLKMKTLGITVDPKIEHTMFVASLEPTLAAYLFEDPSWQS